MDLHLQNIADMIPSRDSPQKPARPALRARDVSPGAKTASRRTSPAQTAKPSGWFFQGATCMVEVRKGKDRGEVQLARSYPGPGLCGKIQT